MSAISANTRLSARPTKRRMTMMRRNRTTTVAV
jgi:hypothetical protein